MALVLGLAFANSLMPRHWSTAASWISPALADGSGGDDHGSDGGGHSGSGGGGGSGSDGGGDDHGGSSGSGSGGDDHGESSGSGSGDDDSSGEDESGDDEFGDDEPDTPGESDRGGRNDEVPGEIVVLNEDAAFFVEVRGLGFRVIAQQSLDALGITVTRLSVPGALTPAAAQNLLRERYPTLLTDGNGLYRAQGSLSLPAPDYPERLIGWGHPPPDCGRGIAIGLIDTGLAADHPVLTDRTIERRSFLAPGESPAPLEHGTAIAAILVGAGGDGVPPGLLPGATLRLAEAFLLDAAGRPVASVVGVAAALDWLVQARTPVINLSLAGADNLLLAIAVKRAAALGTVLVAAAGNDGAAGSAAYPAAYPDVLAVAAVDQDLTPFTAGTQGDYIDLAAPGVGIATAAASGGLALVSGSSFAAPYVAAAAAMRIANGLPADSEAVRHALTADARDLGASGHDPIYGWGLLQSAAACSTTP